MQSYGSKANKHPMSIEVKIADSGYPGAEHPADASAEGSLIYGQISQKNYTRDYVDALQAGMQSPPPRTTHEEYVAEAQGALEQAVEMERVRGLGKAITWYYYASDMFEAAINTQPPNPKNEDADDPILYLQWAGCLAKEVESGQIRPYRIRGEENGDHPDVALHDRRRELPGKVIKAFKWIDKSVMEAPVPTEIKAEVALVAANGLRIAHDSSEATTMIEKASELAEQVEDTNSEVIELFKQSSDSALHAASELAGMAMLHLTTETHSEDLAMVA